MWWQRVMDVSISRTRKARRPGSTGHVQGVVLQPCMRAQAALKWASRQRRSQ